MNDQFLGNSMKMLAGAVLAQAIPLLLAPVFTRLYTTGEYGVFSAFVALSGILATVMTMRLDLAVMLPEKEQDAAGIMLAALRIAGLVMLVSGLLLLTVSLVSESWITAIGLGNYVYLLPLSAVLFAAYQVASIYQSRHTHFGRVAAGGVIQQGVFGGAGVGLPFLAAAVNGLVLGRLAGNAIALAWMWPRGLFRSGQAGDRPIATLQVLRRYRQFPIFNMPYSLLGAFTRDLLVLAMTAANQMSAAGFLGLARNLLNAPVYLLSRALSQVFYQRAAAGFRTAQLEDLFISLLHAASRIITPFVVLLVFWAEPLFGFVFGEEWSEAGLYAAMLAPATYLFFFTSWPERLYEVAEKQHVSFAIQLIFDLLNIALVSLLLLNGFGIRLVVAAYAIVLATQQVAYFIAIVGIAGFSRRRVMAWCGEMLAIWVGWLSLAGGMVWYLGTGWIPFGVATLLAIAWSIGFGKRSIGNLRGHS